MEYIISFLITIFGVYLCQLYKGKFAWYILAIQPIIILAALRSINVGYDTHVYVFGTFNEASKMKSLDRLLEESYFAYGYLLVNYAVSRVTGLIQIYLYVIHSIMYGTIVYALYRHRRRLPVWVGIFILCFVYYRESLNTARQFIALSFDVLAFSYLLDKKWIKVAICTFIAYEFHHSATLFLVIPVLYFLVNHYYSIFNKKYTLFLIVGSIIIILLSFSIVLEKFFSFGILDERFLGYGDDRNFKSNIPVSPLALYGTNIYLFYYWKRARQTKSQVFYEYLVIIAFVLCFSSLISMYTIRIMSYFGYMAIIIYPMLWNKVVKWKRDTRILYLIFLSFYWLMTVVVANLSTTYPYEFGKIDFGIF